jgi:hypothetical protein
MMNLPETSHHTSVALGVSFESGRIGSATQLDNARLRLRAIFAVFLVLLSFGWVEQALMRLIVLSENKHFARVRSNV